MLNRICVFICFSQNIHLRFYTNKFISHDALIQYKDILVKIILGGQFMLGKTTLTIFPWNLKAATAYFLEFFQNALLQLKKLHSILMFSIILINFLRPHYHRLLIEIISYFGIKFHLKIIFVCSWDVNILRFGIFNHITNYAMDHYQRKLPSSMEKEMRTYRLFWIIFR